MFPLLTAAIYEQSLLDHLNGQPFQIVLLVSFAIYSIRRQNASEARMEKYISEDRERMISALDNNTHTLDKFNELWSKITKITVTLLVLIFCGCRTVKKESSISSSHIRTAQTNDNSLISDRFISKRDSLFGFSGRKISNHLSGDDLKPLFNDKGVAKPNTTNRKENGMTLETTVQPDGTIVVNASCDSLTFLVQGLTTENNYLRSVQNSTSSQVDENHSEVKESKSKTMFSGLTVFAFVAGMACCWVLNRFNIPTLIKTLFNRA